MTNAYSMRNFDLVLEIKAVVSTCGPASHIIVVKPVRILRLEMLAHPPSSSLVCL
jgi:hypothetical protein